MKINRVSDGTVWTHWLIFIFTIAANDCLVHELLAEYAITSIVPRSLCQFVFTPDLLAVMFVINTNPVLMIVWA